MTVDLGTFQGLPLSVLILGGGQLTVDLGRICEDLGSMKSVDPGGQSTVDLETFQGLPLNVLILGGSQSTVDLGRICKDLERICKKC